MIKKDQADLCKGVLLSLTTPQWQLTSKAMMAFRELITLLIQRFCGLPMLNWLYLAIISEWTAKSHSKITWRLRIPSIIVINCNCLITMSYVYKIHIHCHKGSLFETGNCYQQSFKLPEQTTKCQLFSLQLNYVLNCKFGQWDAWKCVLFNDFITISEIIIIMRKLRRTS